MLGKHRTDWSLLKVKKKKTRKCFHESGEDLAINSGVEALELVLGVVRISRSNQNTVEKNSNLTQVTFVKILWHNYLGK